jgi:hypothetical protein
VDFEIAEHHTLPHCPRYLDDVRSFEIALLKCRECILGRRLIRQVEDDVMIVPVV